MIHTTRSLISAGTERMLVGFGKANPIEKARQQPDKVRMVLDKVKTDGLIPRFAPQVLHIKTLLAGVKGLKSFVLTVNAGAIASDHILLAGRA